MTGQTKLVQQEILALQAAAAAGVPRVVRMIDTVQNEPDQVYLVLE